MMTKVAAQGVYTFDFFGDEVAAGFSGREFEREKRPAFLRELSLDPASLVLLRQIHSTNLVMVSDKQKPAADCPADGMLTRTPGVVLGVQTADCVPVFFWDPEHRAVGIAHAGWRGIYYGINQKTIQAFRQNFLSRPKNIQVALGPAIRQCCYEVGPEFQEFFPRFYAANESLNGASGKGYVDLVSALKAELVSEGIEPEHIHDCGYCTSCRNDQFFSYRKEKETPERILSVISLRA